MKKIILAMFLTIGAMVATQSESSAQVTLYKATSTLAGITSQTNDSITNTETTYFMTRTGALGNLVGRSCEFSFLADTTSGTPTTINVIQEGSVDGTTWFTLSGGAGLGVDGVNCDSLTMTTAANTTFRLTSLGGGGKYIYGFSRTNMFVIPNYVRLKFVAASGTHNTVISNVKFKTKN
jgi:hypothetical protein